MYLFFTCQLLIVYVCCDTSYLYKPVYYTLGLISRHNDNARSSVLILTIVIDTKYSMQTKQS
jgi:hypothetical protein